MVRAPIPTMISAVEDSGGALGDYQAVGFMVY